MVEVCLGPVEEFDEDFIVSFNCKVRRGLVYVEEEILEDIGEW